jgi:hypothetical protein
MTRFSTVLIQLSDCFLQPAKAFLISGTDDLLENLKQFVDEFDRLSAQD